MNATTETGTVGCPSVAKPASRPRIQKGSDRQRVGTGAQRILPAVGTKSRETIYGASVRAAAERAAEARKDADRGHARKSGFRPR